MLCVCFLRRDGPVLMEGNLQEHWSNFLFDVELFTALGWGKCGHLVKCCHFQGWCFHELSEWAHPVLHWGVRTEGDESKSLWKKLVFFKDFVSTEGSPVLSWWFQGFRELSYLEVPSFPELLVYGLIGCQHDEAWDHEIESGQSKKECDIVSGKGEEGRKKRGC